MMKTRRRARLGDTIDLLDDNAERETHQGTNSRIQTKVKTRSRTKLGDTVDLLEEDDDDEEPMCQDDSNPAIHHAQEEEDTQMKIGQVGYKFHKYFNEGWYAGEVFEIRPGASKWRCFLELSVYSYKC